MYCTLLTFSFRFELLRSFFRRFYTKRKHRLLPDTVLKQRIMKELVFLFIVLYASHAVMAKTVSPKVQIYSRNPGLYGTKNVLICHVSGFHPPEIKIDLLKNGQEIADVKQTDLAFEENWQYHLTKHANFTPAEGERYICRVTHVGTTTHHEWDADV